MKNGTTTQADDDEDDQIKDKGSKAPETDAQRKQREAIEKQRKQQEEMLARMKLNIEQDEAKEMEEAEKRIDATAMDTGNVDIDDI